VSVKQKVTANRKSLFFNFLPAEHFILDQPDYTKKKKIEMWCSTEKFCEQ